MPAGRAPRLVRTPAEDTTRRSPPPNSIGTRVRAWLSSTTAQIKAAVVVTARRSWSTRHLLREPGCSRLLLFEKHLTQVERRASGEMRSRDHFRIRARRSGVTGLSNSSAPIALVSDSRLPDRNARPRSESATRRDEPARSLTTAGVPAMALRSSPRPTRRSG
jgi:hypothetical protein